MHSPFDLLTLLLVISAARIPEPLSPEGTVGLLVGADAGTLLLIAPDAVVPSLGLKPAIRGSVASNNFPATLLNGFLAFLLFAGALQVNSADLLTATAPVSEFLPAQLIWLDNCHRARKLGRCRELLGMVPVARPIRPRTTAIGTDRSMLERNAHAATPASWW